METLDERDLMVRVGRRQDAAAFAELVRRWDQRILAFLTKATGDAEAAKDLRQEVFLRLYRYGASYDPAYAFSTWLYRITRNVLTTWRTKQGKSRAVDGAVEAERADGAPNPRDCAVGAERNHQLRAAIAKLSVEERELLLWRFEAGLSYRTIGEIQGAPETTVKSRVYALLGRLRESLDRSAL